MNEVFTSNVAKIVSVRRLGKWVDWASFCEYFPFVICFFVAISMFLLIWSIIFSKWSLQIKIIAKTHSTNLQRPCLSNLSGMVNSRNILHERQSLNLVAIVNKRKLEFTVWMQKETIAWIATKEARKSIVRVLGGLLQFEFVSFGASVFPKRIVCILRFGDCFRFVDDVLELLVIVT